jgi:hypothetical protein
MGYLRPTAIIVGASYGDPPWIEVAHNKAYDIFAQHGFTQLVSEIVDGVSNGEQSFLVAWDGSKEGWESSDRGDEARSEFVAWLREQAYEDGSSPLDWVEVQYGGDDREAVVISHSGLEQKTYAE